MNFTIEQISFANLHNGNFDAVWFSIFGMAMVFGGLVVISLYIAVLPKILALPSMLRRRNRNKSTVAPESGEDDLEQEILLAIAAAYHLSENFPGENEKITWTSHGALESPWRISGRVHGLSVRNQVGVNNLRRR